MNKANTVYFILSIIVYMLLILAIFIILEAERNVAGNIQPCYNFSYYGQLNDTNWNRTLEFWYERPNMNWNTFKDKLDTMHQTNRWQDIDNFTLTQTACVSTSITTPSSESKNTPRLNGKA